MEQSLFRYIPEEYVESFIKRGEILFRPLSYYRDFEDKNVRRDEYEGTKIHLPIDGLKITKVDTGEEIPLAHTFESTAKEDDIFVYCLSTTCSGILAEKFEAKSCIEILKPMLFIGLIQNALNRRPSIKNKHLEHNLVKYYESHEPPIIDWALPERIALSKLSSFSWQNEYRIAFAVNGAFDVYNVETKFVPIGEHRKIQSSSYPERRIKLGNLSKICKIHHF